MPKEKYTLHFQRFVFFIFRISIKYEAILTKGKQRETNIIRNCEDPLMNLLYKSYPYDKLPLPKRIFFFLMKYKLIYPLIYISKLDNIRNKVI